MKNFEKRLKNFDDEKVYEKIYETFYINKNKINLNLQTLRRRVVNPG